MVQTAPLELARSAPPVAADLRRREILSAASHLFRENGLERTGMREIAAELGLTAGSLYYYFRSKQDLLDYCQRATLDELLRGARRIEATDEPADRKLERCIEAHVVCINETYPGSLAHLDTGTRSPARGAHDELRQKRREYERILVDLIATGAREGRLRAGDARLTALALLGAMNWTVQWFTPGGEKSPREVGATFARIFLEGLRSEAD